MKSNRRKSKVLDTWFLLWHLQLRLSLNTTEVPWCKNSYLTAWPAMLGFAEMFRYEQMSATVIGVALASTSFLLVGRRAPRCRARWVFRVNQVHQSLRYLRPLSTRSSKSVLSVVRVQGACGVFGKVGWTKPWACGLEGIRRFSGEGGYGKSEWCKTRPNVVRGCELGAMKCWVAGQVFTGAKYFECSKSLEHFIQSFCMLKDLRDCEACWVFPVNVCGDGAMCFRDFWKVG